jgi:hypothetical protein
MLQRMIDDVKDSAGTALRLTSLAAAVVFALFVAIAFLCAAAFVAVLQTYGPIQACLTGAGLFLLVAMLAAAMYLVRRRNARAAAAERTRSAMRAALADPVVVATGLQLVRAIGLKRLIPLLAVGGIALGLLAGRHVVAGAADEAPAE